MSLRIEDLGGARAVFAAIMMTLGALVMAFLAATGYDQLSTVLIGATGFIVMALLGARLVTSRDRFLATLVPLAYIAKLGASGARYWVLQVLYHGSGDASGYHGYGTELNDVWRSLQIPDWDLGTEFVRAFTGLLYTPYEPTKLGGFFLYASLAFVGQVLLYLAFRCSIHPRRLKAYAAVVFFLPTIIYWPSSIGKDSLMLLGLGAAAYGASHLFVGRRGIRPILAIGAGLALSAVIRPHMAAMIAGAILVALTLASSRGMNLRPFHRFLVVVVVGVGVGVLTVVSASEFNIDLDSSLSSDVDSFVTNLEDNTDKGGSAVQAQAIRSPADIPSATLRVLFRPLLHEAHNGPSLASALEGTALLAIFLWRFVPMIKAGRRWRTDPYVVLSTLMVVLFIVAFASFSNLGLLARERSQVMPFLLVLLVQLGWPPHDTSSQLDQNTLPSDGAVVERTGAPA